MKKGLLFILSLLFGIGTGMLIMGKKMSRIICKEQTSAEKFFPMYQTMEKWVRIKQKNQCISEYFRLHDYKRIAVYGMGDIGVLFVKELEDSGVDIVYGIDRNPDVGGLIKVYHPNDTLPDVDAVIVTAVAYFDEIEGMLSKKMECPVLSIEDIVFDLA